MPARRVCLAQRRVALASVLAVLAWVATKVQPTEAAVCQGPTTPLDSYQDRSNAFCSKYASACKGDGTAYSDCKADTAKMILGKFGDTAGARTHARTHLHHLPMLIT